MSIEAAIRHIQTFERGCQGTARIHQIRKIISEQRKDRENKKLIKKGGVQ
jgi:hypothetical protein